MRLYRRYRRHESFCLELAAFYSNRGCVRGEKKLLVSLRALQAARLDSQVHVEAEFLGATLRSRVRLLSLVERCIAHDTAFANHSSFELKLRLDENKKIRAGRSNRNDRREYFRDGYE